MECPHLERNAETLTKFHERELSRLKVYNTVAQRIVLYRSDIQDKRKHYNVIIFKGIVRVLHGCETWSLTLREECRLRVFENRIPRRIFGLKRGDNGGWRRLHNEELHSLYRSPNIVKHGLLH